MRKKICKYVGLNVLMPQNTVSSTLDKFWSRGCCRPGNITSTRAMWDLSLKKRKKVWDFFSQAIVSNQANRSLLFCRAQALSFTAEQCSVFWQRASRKTGSQSLFSLREQIVGQGVGLLESTIHCPQFDCSSMPSAAAFAAGSEDLQMLSTTDLPLNSALIPKSCPQEEDVWLRKRQVVWISAARGLGRFFFVGFFLLYVVSCAVL